ncbi:MAG: tetratricopeptide repeat protein [Gammaproteobacteria bacterium]|nr:tetratricopeptide repeat protein [Gammaproteobacteria bacterium]
MSGISKKAVIELSKKGSRLFRSGQLEDAEKAYLEAKEIDEENPYVLSGLGDVYRKLNRFAESGAQYDAVLNKDPTNIFALRGAGDARRGMKQPLQAIPYWLRYLEINPKDSHVMVRIADAYHKLNDAEDAIDFYQQSLVIKPFDPFALLGLGNVYYAQHNDVKALHCFEKLLSKNTSHNVVLMTMIGNIYRRRKEFDRAMDHYENALDIDPKNNFALFGMGDCFRGQLKLEKAVYWWDKILDQEPENQSLWTRVGDALVSLDRFDEAVLHYSSSLKVGHDLYAMLGLARVEHKQGNFEKACDYCEQALEVDNDNVRALEEMARICDDAGFTDKAQQARDRIN